MPPTTWFDLKVPAKNRPTLKQWYTYDYFKTRDKMLGITDSKKIEKDLRKQRAIKRKRTFSQKVKFNILVRKMIKYYKDAKAMPPPPPRIASGVLKRTCAMPHKKRKITN